MKTRLTAYFAGLLLLVAGVTGLVGSVSQATGTDHHPVCGTWKMRGATGAYPAVVFGGPPEGSSVHRHSAKLVKPDSGVQPGVEFAAFDLEVQAPQGDEILVGVHYATHGGATTVAGAIRFFGYKTKNADTLNDKPDYGPAVAASESGLLVLTVPAGQKLGTLGMVYDASNSSKGSVVVAGMKIDKTPVWFTPCPQPEPTVTPTPTPTATQTPTPSPSQTVTASPTTVPTPVPSSSAGAAAGLPITGSAPLWLVLAGLSGLGAGGLLLVLTRRRRLNWRT